jgi:predicted DCC family thiol-disulfide oxidoreductase YuxK
MIPIDMPRDPSHWIVLYDRDCGFCRWCLAQVLALDHDRRLRPVPIDSDEGDALLADMPQREREASWHLVFPDGRRLSAGAAAPPLLRLLRGGRVPAAALAAVPRATERSYRFVADHRSWFSQLIPASSKARADRMIARYAAAADAAARPHAAASAGS